MQATETDNKLNKVKGDECINFRPSPNFKHMKKYLKSDKILEEMSGTQGGEESSVNMTMDNNEMPKNNMMVQPPLPPNPPPPDTPIVLKKEIDDSYVHKGVKVAEEVVPKFKNDSKSDMCLRFARGMCDKGSSCRFAHEIIYSQLPKVYTFCKDYQNEGCNYPKCRYVHATVFEKENFFRTFYLPPHVFAHLEDNRPMPPMPPMSHVNDAPPPVPSTPQAPKFVNPPPPVMHPRVPSVPVLGCAPPPNVVSPEILGTSLPVSKRKWSDIDELNGAETRMDLSVVIQVMAIGSGTPRDLEPSKTLQRCKKCDVNEFRLQCKKNKFEKMLKSSEEMKKRMALLAKKNEILCNILLSVSNSNNGNSNNSILNNTPFNSKTDKDKLLDKINMFFSSSNRIL